MPITYDKHNDRDTQQLMREAMQKYCSPLQKFGVRIDTIFARNVDGDGKTSPAVMLHGYPCAATAKINGLKARALGQGDGLITIDEVVWDSLDDAGKLALLHHELFHFDIAEIIELKGGETSCTTDDASRPKLKMRKHDWELGGFAIVAETHGSAALEVAGAVDLARKYGQVLEAAAVA